MLLGIICLLKKYYLYIIKNKGIVMKKVRLFKILIVLYAIFRVATITAQDAEAVGAAGQGGHGGGQSVASTFLVLRVGGDIRLEKEKWCFS